jgi:site-specific recombinase XerD
LSLTKEELEQEKKKKLDEDEAYQNFINSLQSEYTKTNYRKSLNQFLSFLQLKDFESSKLLNYDVKTMENLVRDYILDMRKRNLSLSTINCSCAALKHFFDINDFDLRWSKKLVKFKGNRRDNVKSNEIRGYTIDEISRIYHSAQDQRVKVMVLLMCSSGIRVGTFLSLRIRNLIPIDKYGIYQVVVYENTSSQHYTFCSQECRKEIDNYLEFRKRNGETIRPESPLLREQFNTRNRIGSAKPRFIKYRSLTKMIEQVIYIDAGIRRKKNKEKELEEVVVVEDENTSSNIITTQTHSFRRFWETSVIKEGLSPLYANMLMNHDIGLEKSYFKPTVTDLLEGSDKMCGYIHVMNAVTINDEYRLKKENSELKKQGDYQKFIIDKRMNEKDQQMEKMQEEIISLKHVLRDSAENMVGMAKIIEYLGLGKNKEKKRVPLTPKQEEEWKQFKQEADIEIKEKAKNDLQKIQEELRQWKEQQNK